MESRRKGETGRHGGVVVNDDHEKGAGRTQEEEKHDSKEVGIIITP